jgi:hypothetical protein
VWKWYENEWDVGGCFGRSCIDLEGEIEVDLRSCMTIVSCIIAIERSAAL